MADEPPKVLYADIAARPGLRWRSALVSAVSGGLVGAATGLDWSLLWLLPLIPIGVALSVIDWHTMLLPRRIVVPATLAAILLMVVVGLATDQRDALVRALVAMLVARSFFWVLWFVRSAGMGFGDVRLAAPVGLVLGWLGLGSAGDRAVDLVPGVRAPGRRRGARAPRPDAAEEVRSRSGRSWCSARSWVSSGGPRSLSASGAERLQPCSDGSRQASPTVPPWWRSSRGFPRTSASRPTTSPTRWRAAGSATAAARG